MTHVNQMVFEGSSLQLVPSINDHVRELHLQQTASQSVSTIEYVPPAQSAMGAAATQLDVAVLPEGQMDASGLAIQSFTLQTTPGKQFFVIPNKAAGKALWLRIAGPADAARIAVGDFKILK